MKESGLRDRVVDVAEELYKFSLLVGAPPLLRPCNWSESVRFKLVCACGDGYSFSFLSKACCAYNS